MKLRQQDIVSYQGQDFEVEGVVTYSLGGKAYPLARVVDGEDVRYCEPLMDDMDDRVLWLKEVDDLDTGAPPPPTIAYEGRSYVPRLSGTATVSIVGQVPGRAGTQVEMWRYRAAGDVFLQIEKWNDRVVILAGDSVHKGMIDVLPRS